MNDSLPSKDGKVISLFLFLLSGFVLFLGVMLYSALKDRAMPSLYTKKTSKATRGSILSADGYTIAQTKKLYRATINTAYLDPDKKELFIKLFSIYSGLDPKEVAAKIEPKMSDGKKGIVVLSYNIAQKEAEYLKQLSYELISRFKIFIQVKDSNGKRIIQGLDIVENGEGRVYNYGTLLTPLIGYINRVSQKDYTHSRGVKGLEARFEDDLAAKEDELIQGPRDVNGYVVLNRDSFSKSKEDGLNLVLTIPISLQLKVERILDEMRVELGAKEIIAILVNAANGDVLSLASSNRYNPNFIKKDDYQSLNIGAIEYGYEPGSVLKPITYALLLDKNLINPYDMINGYNGRYMLGKRTITDEHRFDRLSAQEAIIYSSNIAIAQIVQKLSGFELHNGLESFGFSRASIPDLLYEQTGYIPHQRQLDSEVYKATTGYGYGLKANLMQLIRAYGVFNNNGVMLNPRVIKSFIDSHKNVIEVSHEQGTRIIDSKTAIKVKDVLEQVVNIGTGTKAKMDGLVIGGKTGTAHIVEAGKYVRKYNTSFIGFANDKQKRYNLAIRVIEPSISQFAAQTSVPVFKKIVELLIEEGYLKPDVIEQPSISDDNLN